MSSKLDHLFSIDGKHILLTGAGGLIGTVLCESLLELGAVVSAVDVVREGLDRLEVNMGSGKLSTRVIDISNSNDVLNWVNDVEEVHGDIDVLINAHQYKPVGFCMASPESFPDELWDQIMNVNLKGTYLTCKHVGSKMLKAGKGSIINFASTYGVVSSNPDLYEDNSLGNPLAYSVSKSGVIMLTKYLGVHWASKGVRVNCVTPHGVLNNHEENFIRRFEQKTPMNRMMKASEVVGTVVYLASEASSYVNASNAMVEGGWCSW